MHLTSSLSSALLFISAFIATPIAAASQGTTTICVTSTGTKSVKTVRTKSTTVRGQTTITVVHTSYPTTTTTEPADTTTLTETATTETTTTDPQQTDTVFSTVFDSTTTTVQADPVTSTSTETDTASTTTTLGPFFTGVQDTLPGADPYGNTAVGAANKRDAAPQNGKLSEVRRNILLARASPSTFPQVVTCSKIISTTFTRQKTVSGTSTVTATTQLPESTDTTTTTLTGTQTVVPGDASTTSTITSTIVNTETDTATSTSTTTTTTTSTAVVQASPTVACDSSNYAQSVNGVNIINGTPDTNAEDFYLVGSAGNLDACCSACASNPSCGSFYFTSNGQCANGQPSSSGTCNVNGDGFQVLLGSAGRTTPITVGNGLCGEWSSSENQ